MQNLVVVFHMMRVHIAGPKNSGYDRAPLPSEDSVADILEIYYSPTYVITPTFVALRQTI